MLELKDFITLMEQRKQAADKNGLSDISDSENLELFDGSSGSEEDFYEDTEDQSSDEESDEESGEE